MIKLKYFTAPILGRLAKDPEAPDRQAHYHRALKAVSGDRLEIISGFHLTGITTGFPVEPLPEIERLKVRVMEEKQADVNIALHMYRDAVRGECDCAVLCSNDSDPEPVLSMIRADLSEMTLGLVLPRKASNPGGRKSGKLVRRAHWVRHQIQGTELEACQMSDILLDRRKRTIRRPKSW
ncbi:MAG: NYN domain-containing protein [Proteobacteria bacterium]|nr:NYN domain-containing protein [Pseudomonadota bacterium]